MPRKVNYDVDCEDDYCDYDYEDYDDDYDVETTAGRTIPVTYKEIDRPALWSCPICTYDNEETMSSCDICGVLRTPLANSSSSNEKKSAGGTCKDSGASIMAKSIFASLPRNSPPKTVIYSKENDGVVDEEGNYQKLGNVHSQFQDFGSHCKRSVNIAPFRFDVQSPDDLVSKGLHSSKSATKANSFNAVSSNVSLNASGKNGVAEMPSSSKQVGSSATSTSKGKSTSMDEPSANGAKSKSLTSAKQVDSSVTSTSKGISTSMDEPSANGAKSKSLTSSLNNISLNDKSGPFKDVSVDSGRPISRAQYQPDKWMIPDQGQDMLTQLNLAIVGHVDSGKSTLSGRLLHLLGRISQKQMHKYEKEAKQQGKGSFAYAWALDESAEERERGITMTVAVAYLDSKKYHIVLLDSPGHKDFVPNMISGATQADAAILVIDASVGGFEAGLSSKGGQTREHAQLIKSFGVDQLIVAVNKLDTVEYSKKRFDLIKVELGTFLRSCHFKDSSISWIPVSAMENQNLVAGASDARLLSWYKGPHLLDAVDALKPPVRDFAKPLLMPICDVIKSSSMGQVTACGKLEAGALRSGLKVLVMPSGEVATIRSVEQQSKTCTVARAGDSVAVTLQSMDESRVIAGGILCHPDFPVAVTTHLELKVLVLDIETPILMGTQLEFHIHHAKEAARVGKLLSLLDSKTGKVTKKAPRCLTSKQSAIIEVVLNEPVCVEEFSSCKALGRVFLRASGRTIALGIVSRVINDPE